MGTVVLGTGSCLPAKKLTNHDLEQMVDTSDEWISTRTGIRERRIAGKGEEAYVLAARASEKALDEAGLSADDIDIIIVATISSHMLMPSCACFVQAELGASCGFAFDVNAACSGFLYGFDIADRYVRTGKNCKVLLVGTETLSSRVDWQDRNTCILFGDGAGAVVLGFEPSVRGILGSRLQSDGRLWEPLCMYAPQSTNPDLHDANNPGSHVLMEGSEVFKYAVKAMANAVTDLLEQEKLTLADVKLVIPHQANIRILNNLVDRLNIADDAVFINVDKYGNTSAASIPIALDEASRAGRIERGDLVLFCSFGGGFTWGASLMRW